MTATILGRPRPPRRRATRVRFIGTTANRQHDVVLTGLPGNQRSWRIQVGGFAQRVEGLTLVQDLHGWAAIVNLGGGDQLRVVGYMSPPDLLARAALAHTRAQEAA